MKNGFSDQLEGWRVTLDAARTNPVISKDLAKQGYTPERMGEGTHLLTAVKEQHQAYQDAMGGQCSATDALQLALKTANATYMFHLKVARLAIPRDRDLWRTLRLNGGRERNYSGWLGQAEAFYAHLPQALSYLKPHGVTAAGVEQAKAQIQAVMDAKVKQVHCKGAAQLSRHQRDEAIADLRDWMRDFIRTAKYIYAKSPQQLELLGIMVPA